MKALRLTASVLGTLIFGSFFSCSSDGGSDDPALGSGSMSDPASTNANDTMIPEAPMGMPLELAAGDGSGGAPGAMEGGPMPVGISEGQGGMTPMEGQGTPPVAEPPAEEPPAEEPPAEEPEPEDPNAPPPCEVIPVSEELRESYDLDPFYTKVALARGVPVLSSDAPSDPSLIRVCEMLVDMLSIRQDVVEMLIQRRTLFSVIGEDELTNDIPEYRNLPDTINQRARGLGGEANGTCAEESILCNRALDRWRGEGICVHEYAHTISAAALFRVDPTFQGRLRAAYQDAVASGRFANTYALENLQEYWAEGVQNWYNTNLESIPSNGVHNEIDKRAELETYDPVLYDLIAELLPANNQFQDCYADVPLPE